MAEALGIPMPSWSRHLWHDGASAAVKLLLRRTPGPMFHDRSCGAPITTHERKGMWFKRSHNFMLPGSGFGSRHCDAPAHGLLARS
jgi:hypothetical protein